MFNKLVYTAILMMCILSIDAQELFYSNSEQGTEQIIQYKSIGRVGKHILLSRERRRKQIISVYANDMSQIREIEISILPKDVLDIDYINNGDRVILLYQYLERNKLFLSGMYMDENGKIIDEPIKLDSSLIENTNEFPLYQVITNSPKNLFMLLFINKGTDQITKMNLSLFNNRMEKIEHSALIVSTPDGSDQLNQFQLDNEGNLIFIRNSLGDGGTYISRADILIKLKGSDQIKDATIQFNKIAIKEIKIAVDNVNGQIIAGAIFFSGKKINAQGIFSLLVNIKTGNVSKWHQEFFSDSLRKELKVKHTPSIRTFDDYYVDYIIPYTNGGFTVVLEQRYTEGTRGIMNDNRSFISEPLPSRVVYNGNSDQGPLFSVVRTPYQVFQLPMESSTRSYARNVAGNVLVLSLNNESEIINEQVLRKEQDEVRSAHTISYTLIKTLNGIRFVYNEKEKNELSLRSASFFPDARIKRYPPAKGTIPNMRLLPRYATQIGPNECIMPAIKSGVGCFTRIVYQPL
jgi:hypothetical protein